MRRKVDESTSRVPERRSDKVEQGAQKTTEKSDAIKTEASKYKQGSDDWSSIFEAAKLLHEVKDIREELSILESLLKQQSSVWKAITNLNAGQSAGAKGPEDLLEEIKEMCKNTEIIQKSVSPTTLLHFTKSQCPAKSRDQVNEVLNLEQNDEGNLRYNPGWIFPLLCKPFPVPTTTCVLLAQYWTSRLIYTVCVSIAITIPLLTIAIYVEDIRKLIKAGWVNLWKPRDNSTGKTTSAEQTESSNSSSTSRKSRRVDDLERGTEVKESS
ncbi:hypothetical protein BDW69DRAFT_181044 [Aspergillus filifer]